MTMRMSSFVVVTGLSAVLLAACLPPSGGRSSRCDDGEERSCPCPGQQVGVQTCDDDGRFGTCRCPASGLDGSLSGDTSFASDGSLVRDRGPDPVADAQGQTPSDARNVPPLRDAGFSDFGGLDRDVGVSPPDMSPPRDGGFVPREDAAVDARPPAPARDAAVALDFGAAPLDPRDGPGCRIVGDCERACEFLEACFIDERVCADPDLAFGRELRGRCDVLCDELNLGEALCDLDRCDQMDRVDPGLAEQWFSLCADEERPGEADAQFPPDGPDDWGAPEPEPRDFGVPAPDRGVGMEPDPAHPGNRGPNCGGCDALCEWTAACFSFHPELCPAGGPALVRQSAASCPALCRNPGLQGIACQFQGCGELSQVAGLIGVDIEEACFDDEPEGPAPNPDPECNNGSFIAGMCWTNLSAPCHRGRATTYCADIGARLPTQNDLERRFDRGWEPGPDYHTMAIQVGPEHECRDGVANVILPTYIRARSYEVWECGDNPGFCNRAVVCVR